jgi:archaeosine-15-forming tRNA-guanine transglycosylase
MEQIFDFQFSKEVCVNLVGHDRTLNYSQEGRCHFTLVTVLETKTVTTTKSPKPYAYLREPLSTFIKYKRTVTRNNIL